MSVPSSEWVSHAECFVQKVDPRVFDGVRRSEKKGAGIDYSKAVAICMSCPVRLFCLEDAVRMGDVDVVRGGLTPIELQKRRYSNLERRSLQEAGLVA